jgi:hypothetical protein
VYAGEAKISVYAGVAYANQFWVSYKEGDLLRTEELARRAEQMIKMFIARPQCLWPLLAIVLHRDDVDQANELAKELIPRTSVASRMTSRARFAPQSPFTKEEIENSPNVTLATLYRWQSSGNVIFEKRTKT